MTHMKELVCRFQNRRLRSQKMIPDFQKNAQSDFSDRLNKCFHMGVTHLAKKSKCQVSLQDLICLNFS